MNRDIFKWIYRNWRLPGPTHVPSPPPGAEETLLVVPFQLCLMCLRPVKPPCFFSVDNPQTYQILRKRKKKNNYIILSFFSLFWFFFNAFDWDLYFCSKLKERKKYLRDREYKPLHEPLLKMLPQACLPPICWAGCPAHWEWLSALRGSTLTAQFPERRESEAQPGRLSIMFKQQGLDWLWHPYNSNYQYQWHNKRALFSKKHQTVHIWISYLGNEKTRLGFLSLFFLEEPCSCFSLGFNEGIISWVQPGSFCTSLQHSVFSVAFDSSSVMIYYIKQTLSHFFSLISVPRAQRSHFFLVI